LIPVKDVSLKTLYNFALYRSGYYGLLRPTSFSHDAWKKSLRGEKLRIIEDQCEEFMEQLGYKKFSQN
jgi:hypothetical protein